MLDENGLKRLSVLKDDPGFAKLNFLSHFRLRTEVYEFSNRNPDVRLTSKGVKLPSDKTGRTPLDYVSCAGDSFKRTLKGPSYSSRMLLLHEPRRAQPPTRPR